MDHFLSNSLLETSCTTLWRRNYAIKVEYSSTYDKKISLPKALHKILDNFEWLKHKRKYFVQYRV